MNLASLFSIILGIFAIGALAVAFWSLSWPRVKGTVVVSIYEEKWRNTSDGIENRGHFHLAYNYSVKGADYRGSSISPTVDVNWQMNSTPKFGSAHSRSKWYREGAVVDVYYCPQIPGWSCLEPGGFGLAFILGAASALLYSFR